MMARLAATLLLCSLLICGFFSLATGQQLDEQEESAPAVPSESSVPRWEYKSIEYPAQNSQPDQLQELGAHGWELVDVVAASQGGAAHRLIYFFKRPK